MCGRRRPESRRVARLEVARRVSTLLRQRWCEREGAAVWEECQWSMTRDHTQRVRQRIAPKESSSAYWRLGDEVVVARVCATQREEPAAESNLWGVAKCDSAALF